VEPQKALGKKGTELFWPGKMVVFHVFPHVFSCKKKWDLTGQKKHDLTGKHMGTLPPRKSMGIRAASEH